MNEELGDLHAGVSARDSVKGSVSYLLRGLVVRLDEAFNANDWNRARSIIAEAWSKADSFGDAVGANTEGGANVHVTVHR